MTVPNHALHLTRRERLRLRLTAARQGGWNRRVPGLSRRSLGEGGCAGSPARAGLGR